MAKIIIGRIPISRVAEEVNVPSSTIRYWSDTFSKYIHPERNAKGNRLYSLSDVQVLKKIKYYTDSGLGLQAVQNRLEVAETQPEDVVKVLVEIRNSLNDLLVQYENS